MDGLALKHPEDKGQLFTQVRCIVTPHSSSSVLELGFPYSIFPLALPSEAGRRDMTLALTLGSTWMFCLERVEIRCFWSLYRLSLGLLSRPNKPNETVFNVQSPSLPLI